MIQLKEAIDLIEKQKQPYIVKAAAETDELYILSLNNGSEGYETVNKSTGETGFMWIWEYMDLAQEGKAKRIVIS